MVQAHDISGGIHFHGHGVGGGLQTPRQLPGDVAGFVNRTSELERIDGLVIREHGQSATAVVCVIAGTAGVGKTSLAVRWAHRQRARFPDGQLYVNLRGYDPGEPVNAHQVLERFLAAFGVAPGAVPVGTEARSELYRSLLADRRVLVVLDNANTVGQVRPLLPGAEGCLTLVTSRRRLSGLVVRDGAARVTLEIFPEAEAVRLLRATTADYRTGDDEREVAELARLCARLPLALRIAAERAAARPRMPLGELIQDLRDKSSLWDALSSEDDEEADAVRTVFAWSYRALPPATARFFRLLGLHPATDFSTQAAAALAGVSVTEARRLLDALVGAHLLEQTARDRHQFHDLLRAYALDQANHEESPEQRDHCLAQMCGWYLHATSAAVRALDADSAADWGIYVPLEGDLELPVVTGYDQALSWIGTEAENLFAIVNAAAAAGLSETTWRLAALLRLAYMDFHLVGAWIPAGEDALESARGSNDKLGECVTLIGLGICYRLGRRHQEAVKAHNAALSIAREINDELQTAAALVSLAIDQWRGWQLEEARRLHEQALDVELVGDGRDFWVGWAVSGLAQVIFEQGHLEEAYVRIREAFECVTPTRYAHAEFLWIQARIQRELGQTAQASLSIHEALDRAREMNNPILEGVVEIEVGRVLLGAGRPDEALAALQHAVTILRRLGDRSREADALNATGEVYQVLDRFDEAIDFHRRAAALHRELADPWQLALALTSLATALACIDNIDEASHFYREALRSIADYDDPRAQALRARISTALGQQHR